MIELLCWLLLVDTNKLRGEEAEMLFTLRAMQSGLTVSKPHGDSASYDVIVDCRGRLSRVQVKMTCKADGKRYRVLCVRGATIKGKPKKTYTSEHVDFIAAYIAPLERWYILPVALLTCGSISIPLSAIDSKLADYAEAWHLLQPATTT